VFDKYDRNHDGKIECAEFKRILKDGNNQLSEDIPNEVIDELTERSQWCADGVITFDEFLHMVLPFN
jgi:Ca2+-binding EF-hand superfamily protein